MWFWKRKKKKNASAESQESPSDELLEEILAGYRAEMAELYENRRRRAIARAGMTEEELIASLANDYAEVYADATAEGMDIVTVGDEELTEDGETEDGEAEEGEGEE